MMEVQRSANARVVVIVDEIDPGVGDRGAGRIGNAPMQVAVVT